MRLKRKRILAHCSEWRSIRANASYRSISFKMIPVFSATSSVLYLSLSAGVSRRTNPFKVLKMMSGRLDMYSTVGERVPICRRKRVLYMWQTSFLACSKSLFSYLNFRERYEERPTSNSNFTRCTTIRLSRSCAYTSFATCATTSDEGSESPSPHNEVFVPASNRETSSFT